MHARALLRERLDAESRRRPVAAVAALAARLAERAGGHAAAVLFYGSNLREAALEGVLDFYVLLDRAGDWPGARSAAMALRVLPPNVGYLECEVEGVTLRAKVAVMTFAQFHAGMQRATLDTTLWARFSQPCMLAWTRSATDRDRVLDALTDAVCTAAHWAAALGPERAGAADFWRALYARTYAAELRVERGGRAADLVERDAPRYADLLPLAWSAAGLACEPQDDGTLAPRLTAAARDAARRHWQWRARLGKPLNLLRLLKAAFTFENAADYAAWKVQRHAGVRLELSDWQRRHPLLAAPGIWWRLRRLGVLR